MLLFLIVLIESKFYASVRLEFVAKLSWCEYSAGRVKQTARMNLLQSCRNARPSFLFCLHQNSSFWTEYLSIYVSANPPQFLESIGDAGAATAKSDATQQSVASRSHYVISKWQWPIKLLDIRQPPNWPLLRKL